MKRKGKSNSRSKGIIDLNLTLFSNPLSQLKEDEMRSAIKSVAAEYLEEFDANTRQLNEFVRSANPLYVLAHYSFYDLMVLSQLESPSERIYQPLEQHSVELLQSWYLTLRFDEVSSLPFQPKDVEPVSECLRSLATAFSLRRLDSKVGDASVLPVELMRMHTQAIRNRGYPEQIFKFLKDVFRPLDAEMDKEFGFKITNLVMMVERLMGRLEGEINGRLAKVRTIWSKTSIDDVVKSYYELLPDSENPQDMIDLCKDKQMGLMETKALLLQHFDLDLHKIYAFTKKDFLEAYSGAITDQAISSLLEAWSLKPGDLVENEKEHFFLNNPVWSKPIIRIGEDKYFWPLLPMFMGFGLEMVELLFENCLSIKSRYENEVRPKYLEDEAERVFKMAFPKATTLRGSIWHDAATGKDFENDLLVRLDSFIIVVECKSGGIAPSARRGGKRLQFEVEKLIKEPAEQSARFVEYLIGNRTVHTFKTKSGKINECDTTTVRNIVRLSVTLDFFGPLTCMSRTLMEGGILKNGVPIAVTMPLVALETVFGFLEGAHQKLHYLSRRSEWERNVNYMADEYDLLAFYLATGFNVGAFEYEKNQSVMIYGLSRELDEYFFAEAFGKKVKKPALALTQWWRDMLIQVEKRSFEGWTDVGLFLLNVNRADQWKFEKSIGKLRKTVRKKWDVSGHENCVFGTVSPEPRKKAMAFYVFKESITSWKRSSDLQAVLRETTSTTGAEDVVVIGVDAEGIRYPYQFVALALNSGKVLME